MKQSIQQKPKWLTTRIGSGSQFNGVHKVLENFDLHTVCQSARCPNRGECFQAGTATFMILGDGCTRGCRFCAVKRNASPLPMDPEEPKRIAAAATALGINYVVVTSVTRDDLSDGGAAQFSKTVFAIKALDHAPLVELLIPDFTGDALRRVASSRPDVLAHNIEVTAPLSRQMRHPRFDYHRSLAVLREMKAISPNLITKSSIMLGLGEKDSDIYQSMRDLRDVGVDILVLGQYLRPTLDNAPVIAYIPPKRFDDYAKSGLDMGFGFVAAHPLARTSYRAKEAYEQLIQAQRERPESMGNEKENPDESHRHQRQPEKDG